MAGKYRKNTKKSSNGRKGNFRKKVLKLLEDQKELKVAQFSISDGFVTDSIAVGDLRQLQPIIGQGTDSNQRIGDSIMLKKVVIRGYYRTSTPGFSTSAVNSRIQLRQFIMQQKGASAQTVFSHAGVFNENNFLENSQPYNGAGLDYLTPVNKSAFSVKRERRMTLYQPTLANLAAGQTSSAGVGLNQSIKYFTHAWNCNQRLEYKTGGEGRAENFKYFMANAINMIDGLNDDTEIRLTYNVTFYYTDA